MTPITDTFDEVMVRAVGVLSLAGDLLGDDIELSQASKTGLALMAHDVAAKLQYAQEVLPAAVQRSLAVWGDRAACVAELEHALETVKEYGTGRGSEVDAHGRGGDDAAGT